MNFLAKPSSEAVARLKTAALLCVLWLLVSLLLSWSRITSPAYGIEADLPLHYHITRAYAYSFNEGNLFPRWAGILDGGRGDALFTFYPPLAYVPGAFLMRFAGVDPLTSLKFTTILILFLAQASAYCFGRAYFPLKGALIVSLFYVLLPGFPLIALKLSFFANAFALALAPFAFRGAHDLLLGKRPSRGLVIFALGMSGVILSHVITTYLCGLVLLLLTLIYLPRAGLRGLLWLAAAGVLVFALTAFFLVPLWIEIGWVKTEMQANKHNYRDYFLFAKSIGQTSYNEMLSQTNDSNSYIFIIQSALSLMLGFASIPLIKRRENEALPVTFALCIGIVMLTLALPWSDFIWRVVPGLKFIQFPWRMIPFISLGCGLLIATSPTLRKSTLENKSAVGAFNRALFISLLLFILIVNLLFTGALANMGATSITTAEVESLMAGRNLNAIDYSSGVKIESEANYDFIPYTANQIYFRPTSADLTFYPPASKPGEFLPPDLGVKYKTIQLLNQYREFSIEVTSPVRLKIDTYYSPNWVARLNGQPFPISIEPGTGLIMIDLPAGNHIISLVYQLQTLSEVWSRRLSLIAWGIFLGWLFLAMWPYFIRFNNAKI